MRFIPLSRRQFTNIGSEWFPYGRVRLTGTCPEQDKKVIMKGTTKIHSALIPLAINGPSVNALNCDGRSLCIRSSSNKTN